MKTILKKLKLYLLSHKMMVILPALALLGSVCFVQVLDRTKIKRKKPIEYIIIHYTANLNPRATAMLNAKYLQKKHRAGTHYCVDDNEVIQCTKEDMVAYAIGDKTWKGFSPKTWLLHPDGSRKVLNHNSLSFEMCLGGGRSDSLILDKTAQLVGWQLVNKGLDISRVLRHHDVTGKHCPKFSYNENWNQVKEDSSFNEFKNLVVHYQSMHLARKHFMKSTK